MQCQKWASVKLRVYCVKLRVCTLFLKTIIDKFVLFTDFFSDNPVTTVVYGINACYRQA